MASACAASKAAHSSEGRPCGAFSGQSCDRWRTKTGPRAIPAAPPDPLKTRSSAKPLFLLPFDIGGKERDFRVLYRKIEKMI
jgi:hypothetical protein